MGSLAHLDQTQCSHDILQPEPFSQFIQPSKSPGRRGVGGTQRKVAVRRVAATLRKSPKMCCSSRTAEGPAGVAIRCPISQFEDAVGHMMCRGFSHSFPGANGKQGLQHVKHSQPLPHASCVRNVKICSAHVWNQKSLETIVTRRGRLLYSNCGGSSPCTADSAQEP